MRTYCTAKTLLVGFGLTAFFGLSLGLTAQAQDKKGDKEPPAPAKPAQGEAKDAKDGKLDDNAPYRLRNIVRLGYTRPANEDDPRKDGKIVPLAFSDYQGKIVGGTVYFMVLERNTDRDRDRDRDGSDNWGTGIDGFDGRFIAGRNFDGGVSPQLDRRAKYVYLYQVVNDRGLDPQQGVAFANAFGKVRAQDVASFGLKLLVDPRYITSWGHFQGSAFTGLAKDRNQINEVKAAVGGKEESIRLAVSANPSVLAELPQHQYRFRSPAYSLGQFGRTFDLGVDTLNLAKSYQADYLKKNKDVLPAAFVGNELAASVEGGREPAFVQVMYFTGNEAVAGNAAGLGFGAVNGGALNAAANDLDDASAARGIFRVDWRAGSFVKHGQQSVLFGFTSDLPPVDEPIGIADPEAALAGSGIRLVVADPNITPAQAPGVAPGTAPTPTGGPGGGATGGALIPGGSFGTMGGLGGGGGVGGIGFPGGALGAARAPAFGGGGGFGGGTSGATPAASQAQQAGQQAGTTVNVNATLANQQQQTQSQQQQQQQGQVQNNGNNNCPTPPPHNVVPAPASLLLGLLGMPGLFFLRRRTRAAA